MNVLIYSRYSAERLIQNRFPDNTAVICFYNPSETHLDYSGIAEDVIYIPLDSFQKDLPQADMIADFIRRAKSKNKISSVSVRKVRAAVQAALRRSWSIVIATVGLYLMMTDTSLTIWFITLCLTHLTEIKYDSLYC